MLLLQRVRSDPSPVLTPEGGREGFRRGESTVLRGQSHAGIWP
jgi:hypothetical protein